MFNSQKIIDQLNKIPYATVYNFQPWTAVNKQADLKYSLQYPDRLLMELRKKEIVRPVLTYPRDEEKMRYREKTFYTLKNLSPEHLSQRQTYNGEIAHDMIRHQSGLMDIFLAFINLYPDYTVEIDWNKKFPYKKEIRSHGRTELIEQNYIPDAFIKLTSLDLKEYHFIVEFERTKANKQIRQEKFLICDALDKFGAYGLSRYTKFLFVVTYEFYNVFARPIENEKYAKYQAAVDKSLDKLIQDNKDILNDCYRLLPFHKFDQLNKSVWKTYRCDHVPLIPEN